VFDILKHPIQRVTFDRMQDLNGIASNKLTIAVDGCGARVPIRGLQQGLEKLWRCGVVMLSVTEKLR
jgi:L-asparaginase II